MERHLLDALKILLKETFDGPPPEGGSWYTESKPGSGLFGTLENVSAEQAMEPTPGGGAPLCAHVHHVAYYLGVGNAFLRGEKPEVDWSLSWKVRISDEEEWKRLVEELRREYGELMNHLAEEIAWTPSLANGVLGCLAHSAYHLGSIRQMVKGMGISLQSRTG
ncbi:DinB family protein [Staphylospora marina]|uniref:DinB family protein n=1 Tax=Staphylospora marina TaxID=2490858 RepID=UPI000F5BF435|nr:hypothetical protein [Staphylospora marina]